MNKKTAILLLVIICTALPALAAMSKNISPAEAFQLMQNDRNVFLLDVRTPQEYMQMRIEGALLIPISQIEKRLAEVPKDRPLLVYCAVGSRSSQVANWLARQGYDVYNMYGGIYSWQGRGYPILTGAP